MEQLEKKKEIEENEEDENIEGKNEKKEVLNLYLIGLTKLVGRRTSGGALSTTP
jgi:hypothetical protein